MQVPIESFAPVFNKLSASHHVFALSLTGFGARAGALPPNATYSFATLSSDVIAFATSVTPRRFAMA
eukprot:6190801-Pleurochrysis_carterae.AAC.2